MIRKTAAVVILSFLSLSVAPLQLDNKAKKEEKLCVEQVAGMEYTKFFEKCVRQDEKSITKSDYDLICRTVYCEAGNQSLNTQMMVALTILNRLDDEKFPNTVRGVVYQKNAYAVTGWKNFEQYEWTEQVEKAVNIALEKNIYPKDMFYFRTEHFHKFGKPYAKSGDLWFSTET